MAPKGTITDGMIQELLARPWGGGLQSDIVKSIATGGDFLRRGVGAVGRVAKDIESVPAFAAAASLNYLTGGGAQGLVDKRGQALENTMNRYGLGDNTTTMPTKNISISPQSNQVKPTMPSPAANQPEPTKPKEPAFGSREWATSKFKSPDEAHAWLSEQEKRKYEKMSPAEFKKVVGEVNDMGQSNKPTGMGYIEVLGKVPKGGQKFTKVINQKGEAGGYGMNRDLTADELKAVAPVIAARERNDYQDKMLLATQEQKDEMRKSREFIEKEKADEKALTDYYKIYGKTSGVDEEGKGIINPALTAWDAYHAGGYDVIPAKEKPVMRRVEKDFKDFWDNTFKNPATKDAWTKAYNRDPIGTTFALKNKFRDLLSGRGITATPKE